MRAALAEIGVGEENHAGAMADLCATLRYRRHGGADPVQAQHLIAITEVAERQVS